MNTRRAGIGDANELAALNQHVHDLHVEAESDDFKSATPDDAAPYFARLLHDDQHVFYLAEDAGGAAVGYIWAHEMTRGDNPFTKPSRTMYIHHIAVAPESRRAGVGRALVAAVESEARQRGISRLGLDYWSFNEVAGAFFRSLGYEPYNIRMRRRIEDGKAGP